MYLNKQDVLFQAICNFGYGNTHGHPGHEVLDDLKGSVVLNSQFLRFTTIFDVWY